MKTDKINAMGRPAPNRTDFTLWRRDTLEAFAREAADENLVLRENNKALHEAWRQAILRDSGLCAGAQEDLARHL
jgi:hypothetical protein